MKSSAFIGILLTFLMALLVMASAIVFLWQGRQEMQGQINALETEVAVLSDAQIRAEANLASESAARSTAQADLGTRQAEFDLSEQESIALQQEVAALAGQLTRVNLTAVATGNPAVEDPPLLYLFLEPDGTVPLDTLVNYTIIMGHNSGVARGTIIVNGEVLNNFQANDLLLVSLEGSYAADTPGEITFQVVATSTMGIAGSTSADLTVLEPAPIETPTPSPTPSPSATPPATNTPTSLLWPAPHQPGRGLAEAFIPRLVAVVFARPDAVFGPGV